MIGKWRRAEQSGRTVPIFLADGRWLRPVKQPGKKTTNRKRDAGAFQQPVRIGVGAAIIPLRLPSIEMVDPDR